MLQRALIRLLARLPLGVLHALAGALYLLAWRWPGYRRGIVLDNLRRCFPERDEAWRWRVARGFYRNLADLVVESIKGLTIERDELAGRVRFRGAELLEAYAREGRSVVLVTTHQCNWEWLLLAACVQLPFPIDAVYKPLHRPHFDALLHDLRARFGGNPVAVDDVMRELARRRGETRAFAVVGDQRPLRRQERHAVRFLGRDTSFFVGAAKLARLTRRPLVFLGMRRVGRGRYEVEVKKLAEPPYAEGEAAVVERYAAEAERLVRESPCDWLWSHRRWKGAGLDEGSPADAAASRRT